MSLLFALVILWAVHCMMIVAPPRPAPGRAGATFLLATILVLPICFAQAFLHLWPEAMSVPILAAILLASLLGFWWLLRNLEPRRLRDVRPPARRDGLATKVSLQLNVLAAALVTALVAGLELVVAGPPAWRITKLSVVPAAFMPAYVLLALTLLILTGTELVRARSGMAVTGEPKPMSRAFVSCVGQWVGVVWLGLLIGYVMPAGA